MWSRVLLCLVTGIILPARTLHSQRIGRIDVFGQVVLADRDFGGIGIGASIKNKGRASVRSTLAAGSFDNRGAVRVEVLADFRLSSRRKPGLGTYVGAGVSLTANAAGTEEYIVLLLGVEANRQNPGSLYWEIGVAGGWRFMAGYRFNR